MDNFDLLRMIIYVFVIGKGAEIMSKGNSDGLFFMFIGCMFLFKFLNG